MDLAYFKTLSWIGQFVAHDSRQSPEVRNVDINLNCLKVKYTGSVH